MNKEKDYLIIFKTLMKVDKTNMQIKAKMQESEWMFKKDIEEHFKNAVKVVYFPRKDAAEYHFRLCKDFKSGVKQWRADIYHKDICIPWESILPFDLIEEIVSVPVDPDETIQIKDFKYRGNIFNISYIKYLEDSIVGIIQRIKADKKTNPDEPFLDVSQFLELQEDEQIRIFMQYFNTCPMIRRHVLFDFFVNTFPNSKVLKEVI
ncbi:MAG: hypothetical protein PVH61_43120 [Candidatus Aminicenantes bacterium]|jgi:hypothetical protein